MAVPPTRRLAAQCDVCDLRFHWLEEKPRLQREITAQRYWFSPLVSVAQADASVIDVWSARDALVLKAIALVLGERLWVSPACVHVNGHGGAKAAVRAVSRELPRYLYVCRTGVAANYESIEIATLDINLRLHTVGRASTLLSWPSTRRATTRGAYCRDGSGVRRADVVTLADTSFDSCGSLRWVNRPLERLEALCPWS